VRKGSFRQQLEGNTMDDNILTHDYDQLCGAVGVLAEAEDTGKMPAGLLNWGTLMDELRDLGGRLSVSFVGDPIKGTPPTGEDDPVHAEISAKLRQYRNMCIDHELIAEHHKFDRQDADHFPRLYPVLLLRQENRA
jgi:hypothetical protein